MGKFIFIVCFIGIIWLMSACTMLDFSCSTGEYGPRANVTFGVKSVLDDRMLEDLSRLCSTEVEEDA